VDGDVAPNRCWYQKTRVFLLPHNVILSLFIWMGYQRVTDRRTERHTDGIAVANTTLCIASNAVRAVKTLAETVHNTQ